MHIFLIMQVKWFEKKTKDAQDKNNVSHHIADVEREIDSNAAIKKKYNCASLFLQVFYYITTGKTKYIQLKFVYCRFLN